MEILEKCMLTETQEMEKVLGTLFLALILVYAQIFI